MWLGLGLPFGGSLRHVVTALLSSTLDCGKNAAGVACVCVCASTRVCASAHVRVEYELGVEEKYE